MRPFQSGLLAPSLSGWGGSLEPVSEPEDSMVIGVEMAASLVGLFLLMFVLLLLLLIFILACRPWRFFSSSRRSSSSSIAKTDDIERPLFSESNVSGQNYYLAIDCGEESSIQIDGNNPSPRTLGLVSKKRVQSTNFYVNQGSSLTLEVIAGPSHGLCCSRLSTNISMLPLTLGRVSPSDLLLKDSEVSGKHARINWNTNNSKWELVDMGSLNGTFLNSRPIHHPDSGSRHWSEPVELANGDIITLGTSSKVFVQILQHIEHGLPFGVGVASDPMAIRRGGKTLPMEDMWYCQWPLPGVEQFGLFGIFDGHGGAGAAKVASKMLPQKVADILLDAQKRERVLSLCDASDILREAFFLTEASMNHQYEGCTATVLLVWIDNNEEVFAQCANVGDSACVINVSGKQITMTEDHRVISLPERTRLIKMGKPLKDGEARLCGLNIGRMLGDKFLKEQDSRFSAEPYVSEVVHISKACIAPFALLASDGLWDVISIKKAVQLVLQTKGRDDAHDESSAERIANYVLSEAKTLRTKDNTSVIFLDFDSVRTAPSIVNS